MYLSFGSLLKLYKKCLIQTVLHVMNMLFAPYEPPEYEFYI